MKHRRGGIMLTERIVGRGGVVEQRGAGGVEEFPVVGEPGVERAMRFA